MTKKASAGRGKGKKRRINETRKAEFLAYKKEDRASINQLRRLERHKKKHPNDKQEIGTVAVFKTIKRTPEDAVRYRTQQRWEGYLKHEHWWRNP